MSQYLPFGKPIKLTSNQYKEQEEKFKAYDYYGIPYGIIDDISEGEQFMSKKEKDREQARLLIMQGKDIPDALKKRLLKYKNEEIHEQIKLL